MFLYQILPGLKSMSAAEEVLLGAQIYTEEELYTVLLKKMFHMYSFACCSVWNWHIIFTRKDEIALVWAIGIYKNIHTISNFSHPILKPIADINM